MKTLEEWTIVSTWEEYRRAMIPPEASPFAVQRCQEAYVAGAFYAFKLAERLEREMPNRRVAILSARCAEAELEALRMLPGHGVRRQN